MQDADPFDLRRFLTAQEGAYRAALSELAAGQKRGHWMWFVFPQIDGLGFTSTSKRYAIKSLAEARAYLDHPVLGARLRECARALLPLKGATAERIFGYPDHLKLRSSMTLFAAAAPEEAVFRSVLERYYEGAPDARTSEILARMGANGE